MPKKIIKRYMPDHHKIRDHKHLRLFGTLLHDANLWHLNRRSFSGAVSVGLFVAFVPVPFQMLLAAALAILMRVNLPISVALVWISNPLTMPAMLWFCHRVGARLLDRPPRDIQFEPTFTWLITELGASWQPLVLGCLVVGLVAALLGNLAVRIGWRLYVVWHLRRKRQRLGREA